MTRYLLDANVFIEAHRRYYGFDFCPGFWAWLKRAHEDGRVFSIEKVRDELVGSGDTLSDWAADFDAEFFLPPDTATIRSIAAAVEWARGQQYRPGAVNAFADDADSYLVAHAHAHGFTLVTHETAGNEQKRVKIPNACVAMKVKFINAFELLRREKVRLDLRVEA
jgi:hypothetical protein